jgi:hypothetical protein
MHTSEPGNWNAMLFVILAAVLVFGVGVVLHKHADAPQADSRELLVDLAFVFCFSPLIASSVTYQWIVYSEDIVSGWLMGRIPFLALISLFDNRHNYPLVWKMFLTGLLTTALTLPVLLLSS